MAQARALSLEGAVVAVAADRGHQLSKPPQNRIVRVEGHRVEDDAHAGEFVRHCYRARRQPRVPNFRQVHLIPADRFASLSGAGFQLSRATPV